MPKIRLILLLVCLFNCFDVFSQNENETQNDEYENRIKMDTINGVYIPIDLDDCIVQLNRLLPDSFKTEIIKMTKDEFTGSVHFGLGMWLRNNWGLWGGSRLEVYLLNFDLIHPDTMSDFILGCYHKSLQGKRINVKQEVKKYHKKYKRLEKEPVKFKAKTIDTKTYTDIDSALLFADEIVEVSLINFNRLPRKVFRFKNLQDIDIERSPKLNWEKTLRHISHFSELKKLSLYSNNVNSYPDEIGNIKQLTTLSVGNDSIKSLPSTISQLENLQELHISNCPQIELSSLFYHLSGLHNLTELWLFADSLKTIPLEICKLQQLKELWLDYNLLTEVPQGVKELPNLETLFLFSNMISEINIKSGDFKQLTYINLCNNNFVEFPIELSMIENLESIMMWSNKIEKIPDEICNLKKLKRLNLANNNLTTLPNGFYKLNNLEQFEFENNYLNDSVFTLLIGLKQLKKIDLDNNNITKIPETICLLENLENLGLSGNEELVKIPETLSELKKLKALGLGDCPNLDLNNLYNVIKNLKLEQLGFYGNDISIEDKQKLNDLLPTTKIYY